MSTANAMASEMARLLSRRRTLWKVLVAILLAISILVPLLLIWQVQAEEAAEQAAEEQSVRQDFQNTWCDTFEGGVSDEEILLTWREFIDRNRSYLESRPELYIETFEGERVLHIEQTIEYFINEPSISPGFVPFEGEIEGALGPGWPTYEYLASGENEFGRSTVLPCR